MRSWARPDCSASSAELDGALHHGVRCVTSRASRGSRLPRVGVHHLGEEVLVEAPPVDADADGLAVVDGHLDDGAEVLVVVLAPDVARVDAVLGERPRAVGVLREEHVAVVVEVADDGHVHLARRSRAPRGAAASLFTVTRTSSLPASWSARTWATVPATSAVSVLVIDWTTMGRSLPTRTPPTSTATVFRRLGALMKVYLTIRAGCPSTSPSPGRSCPTHSPTPSRRR